jgi:hypothetical protein
LDPWQDVSVLKAAGWSPLRRTELIRQRGLAISQFLQGVPDLMPETPKGLSGCVDHDPVALEAIFRDRQEDAGLTLVGSDRHLCFRMLFLHAMALLFMKR